MPYYKRIGGTHRRREDGKMVVYAPGEILFAEEWELKGFSNVFEMVTLDAGRAAMVKRGLDPAEVEGRASTLPPPKKEDVVEETPEPSAPAYPSAPARPPVVGLELKAKGGGWYDVINVVTNKPINDKAMRKKDAESLIVGVQGGEAGEKAKEEAATTGEADPVDGAEAVAGEDGVPVRRRAEPAGQGEDTTED